MMKLALLILLTTVTPLVIPFLTSVPGRIRMRRHLRELLTQHPHAEQTSVYVAFRSAREAERQRSMDDVIAEMDSAGWTFLRIAEANPLRTLRSWGGGLNLHFVRIENAEIQYAVQRCAEG